jgi:hypothetical protein
MAALYADENFRAAVVDELRRLGHDVLTALEAGQANKGIADPDQLAYAIAQRRAVLTYNRRHFVRLASQVSPHAGIIVCTDDPDATALAARIDRAVQACASLDNQLLRINRPPKPPKP